MNTVSATTGVVEISLATVASLAFTRITLNPAASRTSKAAVKRYLQQEYPGLDRDLIDSMANRVAAVVIPKEVHQKISQTYGGRNNSDQIAMDAKNLRNALGLNFDAIKPALKEYGVTKEQLETARAKMHKLNAEQGLYK